MALIWEHPLDLPPGFRLPSMETAIQGGPHRQSLFSAEAFEGKRGSRASSPRSRQARDLWILNSSKKKTNPKKVTEIQELN